MKSMDERREVIAMALHATTLGAFKMGSMMTNGMPSAEAARETHDNGFTFVRRDGAGYDLLDPAPRAQWEAMCARAARGNPKAMAAREETLRAADELLGVLFSDAEAVDALLDEMRRNT